MAKVIKNLVGKLNKKSIITLPNEFNSAADVDVDAVQQFQSRTSEYILILDLKALHKDMYNECANYGYNFSGAIDDLLGSADGYYTVDLNGTIGLKKLPFIPDDEDHNSYNRNYKMFLIKDMSGKFLRPNINHRAFKWYHEMHLDIYRSYMLSYLWTQFRWSKRTHDYYIKPNSILKTGEYGIRKYIKAEAHSHNYDKNRRAQFKHVLKNLKSIIKNEILGAMICTLAPNVIGKIKKNGGVLDNHCGILKPTPKQGSLFSSAKSKKLDDEPDPKTVINDNKFIKQLAAMVRGDDEYHVWSQKDIIGYPHYASISSDGLNKNAVLALSSDILSGNLKVIVSDAFNDIGEAVDNLMGKSSDNGEIDNNTGITTSVAKALARIQQLADGQDIAVAYNIIKITQFLYMYSAQELGVDEDSFVTFIPAALYVKYNEKFKLTMACAQGQEIYGCSSNADLADLLHSHHYEGADHCATIDIFGRSVITIELPNPFIEYGEASSKERAQWLKNPAFRHYIENV